MNFKAPAVVSYIIAYASFHVEDVAKDLPLLEGAEPEAEFPLQPEEVIEDQEQDLEQDLTDFYNTQGKHRCMKTQYHLQSSLTIIIVLMHLSLQELFDT